MAAPEEPQVVAAHVDDAPPPIALPEASATAPVPPAASLPKVEPQQQADQGTAPSAAPLPRKSPVLPASEQQPRSNTPTHHFQHREPGPRKLLKRLQSLTRKPKSQPLSRQPSSRLSRPPVIPENSSPREAPPSFAPSAPMRPNIKIRLSTFNMCSGLPSSDGDLSDFLGEVRSFRGRTSSGAGKSTQAGSTRGSTAGSIFSVPSPAGLPPFPLTTAHPYHIIVVAGQECPTASGVLNGKMRTLDGRGWTSILEDWLCGGAESLDDEEDDAGAEDASRSEAAVSRSEAVGDELEGASQHSRGGTTYTDEDDEGNDDGRRGPYILVEKIRLMGIYLAVFVARSCDRLVDGVSLGRVTAGLIGGRLGNKGGVGISLSFAGSRLLFISAHLAAHASAVEIRKANVRKIFEELEVDDFLGGGLKSGGNVTERFDQTFFLGDLNFRLNISRLHADYIIKTCAGDYSTALTFDQLREVLDDPQGVFKGFVEPPIHFAPTYKYDVQKVKHKRSGLLRSPRTNPKRGSRDWKAFEVADSDAADGCATDPETHQPTQMRDDDALSISSSRDSISSAMSDYAKVEKTDLAAMGLPSPGGKGNDTSMDAMRRAQVRFLTLVKTNSSASAFAASVKKSAAAAEANGGSGSGASTPSTAGSTAPVKRRRTLLSAARPILRTALSEVIMPLPRSTSAQGMSGDDDSDADDPLSPVGLVQQAEACFDSSKKQRVQSFTDRILFKSTVVVDEPAPPIFSSLRRGSTFVDSLKGLVHGHGHGHTNSTDSSGRGLHQAQLDASVGGPPPQTAHEKIKQWKSHQPWEETSSVHGEPRHARFANFFGRGRSSSRSRSRSRFTSRSVESLALGASNKLKRAKSLQATKSPRRASLVPSVKTSASHDPPPFVKRRSSLASPTSESTNPLRHFSYDRTRETATPNFEPHSTAPTTPTLPPGPLAIATDDATLFNLNPFRKLYTRSNTSSPVMSRSNSMNALERDPGPTDVPSHPGVQRSLTMASTRSGNNDRLGSHHRNDSSLGRIRSFFHLPSLPFLNRSPDELEDPPLDRAISEAPIGPRRGEITVLQYDAVTDLTKMGAVSDHRPVFLAVAVGVGGDPVVATGTTGRSLSTSV